MGSAITQNMIDAGAKVLRERTQAGKRLAEWERLPSTTKRKWRDHSHAVLLAAGFAALAEDAGK